jgi:thiamine biosynthesis lipoprotein
MGTVFSIDVREPGVDHGVLERVVQWLHWVDDTFSTYQAESQISRLAAGAITVAQCAPEVGQVLDRCAELGLETSGYFSAYASGQLDPSGLVKGWAIEHASRMLREGGSLNHCVNGGGDVQCAGSANPGEAWRIGIAHPLQPGQLVGVVEGGADGGDLAVATSGSAERGAHIIEPHSGTTPGALASVSLVGRGLGTVDAYATAAYAMGLDAASWIEQASGLRGFVVYADGTVWSSAPDRPAS